MTECRPREIVNPIQTLRDWRASMTPERRAESEAAQAAFSLLTASDLCALNDRLIRQPLSHNDPASMATLWLINLELTQRGIGPRWRGLPAFIAQEPAPSIPDFALKPGEPRPLSYADRKRALLRWVDLEWLCHTLDPQHMPTHAQWRGIFLAGLDERIAAKVANSHLPAHKLSHALGIPAPHCFSLTGLLTKESAQRIATLKKRRLVTAAAQLSHRTTLTDAQKSRRLAWVEAIELAAGRPTDTARIYGWITGLSVTKQTAHEMRTKLADQLGFQAAIWHPKSALFSRASA